MGLSKKTLVCHYTRLRREPSRTERSDEVIPNN
jgi:hypothetical protein